MSSLASIPQNKREQLVSDFTLELGCERSEALKYLSCGNFDYSSSLGLFILTKLLSTKRTTIKTHKQEPFSEKMGVREILPQSDPNSDTLFDQFDFECEPIISLENRDQMSFSELSTFLMSNPSPSWRQRLVAFKLYDQTLLSGFPDALKTKEKIVIDKRLFVIYTQINKNVVTSKNLQRGVIAYLERIGFLKINDRSRKRMVFNWGEN
ncbi:hypothetical protein M0812_05145 [Anaeramoeba flamelloides]|uniref:Uncharacterized protein n=2 Tax=Anaeramoeba flamelloides TaxID=1746091 RepID=A0AAV8AGQ4_9EUKA|nr:hypothetical protein M0812_05131 [Anaeramoeba flamelloides]KAJ3451105.1 hypothetical protein M0812_05145 [Anaeramoeba flamelloides]